MEKSRSKQVARNDILGNEKGIFLSNEANAYDDGLNRWDNGLIGNNYSDFNDPEEGCHGRRVCATPYPIPGGPSIDEHPQASPIWEPGLVSGRNGVFMQPPGFSFPPPG